MNIEQLAERKRALSAALDQVVVGQTEAADLCLCAVLARGHVLLQGVPGVAKTLLARALASTLGVRFGRVQFTPDLMPSDILGSPIFERDGGDFRFRPGPIFTDILLGDEINRAPAKTQAAMLEAMQERAVTVDGTRHALGEVFTVFATQNPVEQEGTYPLPEAELDRFLFRVDIDYPSAAAERTMLALHHAREPELAQLPSLFSAHDLAAARALVEQVTVRDEVLDYALALVRATRDDADLTVGASPRAGIWLVRAAKALSAIEGRDYMTPDDVQRVLRPVLRHRIVLEPSAEVSGLRADDAISQIAERVPVPH